jgi:hypothetical protein
MTKTKNLVVAKLFSISMFMVVHNSFTKPSQDIKTTKKKKKEAHATQQSSHDHYKIINKNMVKKNAEKCI